MNRTMNVVATIGLLIGPVFGQAAVFTSDPKLIAVFYEMSSLGIITGSSVLAVKYMRHDKAFLAIGFLLLCIAEAISSSGAAAGEAAAVPGFGAAAGIYVPAFCMLGISSGLPKLSRVTILLAAVVFGILSFQVFTGVHVTTASPLVDAGYGLLTITIIAWAWHLLREKEPV